MESTHTLRQPVRVADLPFDFPTVPVLEHEASLNAIDESTSFIASLNHAVQTEDWKAFDDLFAELSWWKDNFTMTLDKRTIRGKENILAAWKNSVSKRRPEDFKIPGSSSAMEMIAGLQPSFVRFSPEFATLDVPFTFKMASPPCICAGVAKLVPSDSSGWKVWVMTTAAHSLVEHPFSALPRLTPSLIEASQRGKATPQGFPLVTGVLDALVIGGGCSGLANTTMLDSAGLNVVALRQEIRQDGPGIRGIEPYACTTRPL